LVAGFFEFVKGKEKRPFKEYVESYLIHLRYSGTPQAATSVNLCRDAIAFFAGNVLNPSVSLEDIPRMKESKTLPEPFTREEIRDIFSKGVNKKHLLLLQVTYYGCLRLSDARFLKVRNIRYDRGLIHIEEGKGKKDRFVPFPDCLHETMRNHTNGMKDNDYVFRPQGSMEPYPERTIQRISENACERAKIKGHHNIHRFRHTGAI
jgi:integrase